MLWRVLERRTEHQDRGVSVRHVRSLALIITFTLIAAACVPLSVVWGPGGSLRPYWCDPSDTAINDAHGLPANFNAAYTQPKGPLSGPDCLLTTNYLRSSEAFVKQYPTVADAEAAGWKQGAVWAAGQGIHYVDPSRLLGPFDPRKPNWLMYDGTSPGSLLTGMMYLLDTGSTTPPSGFPGDNDHWHQHGALCTDTTPGTYPFIIGESLTGPQCSSIGGINVIRPTIWMVHVWLPVYKNWVPTDVFNKSHPLIP